MDKREKNNKLIAFFMGYGWSKEGDGKTYIKKWSGQKNIYSIRPKLLSYHSSWDWLRPVVIKMVSMEVYYEFRADCYELYIEGNPLCIFSTTKEYDVNMTLRTLHNEVVEFIKWYNKKEQQQ